jgi:Eukaryotic-type carbonic anhydrase
LPLTLRNTGRSWEVSVPAAWQGRITGGPLGNAVYRLVSLRAHWGRSEHSLAARHTVGEIQLVHINSKYDAAAASVHKDGLAIVSVLMDKGMKGPVNPELEKIREVLPLIQVRKPLFHSFKETGKYRYLTFKKLRFRNCSSSGPSLLYRYLYFKMRTLYCSQAFLLMYSMYCTVFSKFDF